ncbi:MAG: hypothetical protein A2355_07010 [Spirochaetes bacterium RIFOXYB1_FULL_32_8]|nr:MAG: hypothetical protein A2355_07010 [Spirochaetes bacterium RIFOXYB1_FULL_32_8]
MASVTLFLYSNHKSFLHTIHPVAKIVVFFILNLMIFNENSAVSVLIFLFLIVIIFFIQLSFIDLLKRSIFLVYLSLFALIFGSCGFSFSTGFIFYKASFITQSFFIMRLITSFLSTEIVLTTTKISQINDLLTIVFRKIPLINKLDLGLYISITIKFIPAIFMEYNAITNALKIKAGTTIRNPIKKASLIFNPLILNMVRKAITTAFAMEIKCSNRNRVIFKESLRKIDYIVIITGIVFYTFFLMII